MPSLPEEPTAVHPDAHDVFNLFDAARDAADFDVPEWPHPEVDGVVYRLDDFLSEQASYFRSLDTAAGDWLAAEVEQLAALARGLHATTPDQLDGRRQVLERDRDERMLARGWEIGGGR